MPAEKRKGNVLPKEVQVSNYFEELEHPFKAEIEEIRTIIRNACDSLTEQIKWNAPSYAIDKKDRITFNLHGKQGFRLIFHCGSKPTAFAKNERLFEDSTQLLEWITGDRAMISFTSKEEVDNKKGRLQEVILRWIDVTEDIH